MSMIVKLLTFILSILFYLVGMAGLFLLILWLGNLLPFLPFESTPTINGPSAIVKNLSLLLLFGLQHSIMARSGFKTWWTSIISKHLERSIYVLISGLLCGLIVWQWEAVAGDIWFFDSNTTAHYIAYTLYFLGIIILLTSSFIINHFELFGLQQGYFQLIGRKTPRPYFQEKIFYKISRHPIYLGFFLIIWATPHMSITHAILAIGFSAYIYIGIHYEERDLSSVFGTTYSDYINRVPKLLPFTKIQKEKLSNKKTTLQESRE